MTITSKQTEKNPLLDTFKTPFQTPPFDKIENRHYEPAFEVGMQELINEIEAIATNTEAPTFENTIEALEYSGETLEVVSSIFFNLLSAESDDEMMDLSIKLSPKLTEINNSIFLNENLFNRVKQIYTDKENHQYSTEQLKLLEDTYDSFRRKGATLSADDKIKFAELSKKLSGLTVSYGQNVLKDQNSFEMLITQEEQLKGLPESVKTSAAEKAKNKEKEGWLFDLSAPSYIGFMKYADNRDLREKLYKANMLVGAKDGSFDNRNNIKEIVNTRLAIANILGEKSYADYVLKNRMAKSSEKVFNLLHELEAAYFTQAKKEVEEVKQFAQQIENKEFEIMPWDWSYYSNKLKNKKFNVTDEMTRPYFELSKVKEGVFGLATSLYGITFKKNPEIPVYHKDVDAYEVHEENGDFVGILYTDFFPRSGKRSGAWMNNIREEYIKDNVEYRPQIVIVMNFNEPTSDTPALLTFDEVETLLHEFGHALHGLFAEGHYASLSGTNVYRDFVELPSEIMENWLTEKEYLNRIATHYKTGETIPDSIITSLVDASNFNAGYACCRQLSFGFLDMAWHTIEEPFTGNVYEMEQKAQEKVNLLPVFKEGLMSSSFGHIFSGGYAAGYYGYKWSEVLDADAFATFKKNGIFNKDTAKSFRNNILSKGGTDDPMKLYVNFKGKEPTINALLTRNGIKIIDK